MLPLIPIATSLVPVLVRLIGGDKAGSVATTVSKVVTEVTGTDDPAQAQRMLEANPEVAANLRIRLAEIALEAQQAQIEDRDRARQKELTEMKATLEDIQSARRSMVDLAKASSPIAWGAPIVSTVVTVGFFVFLIVLFRSRSADIDPAIAQIINIAVGALTAGFATVINFWLGSSQGSRNKDEVVRRFQENQASQTEKAMEAVEVVATRPPPPAAAVPVTVSPPPATGVAAAAPVETPLQQVIADNFNRCVDIILRHEGGFADHPKDPGGATNFGITLNTLRDWREDPNLTAEDVRNLTKGEAVEIYRAKYWLPMRCNDLPPGVDLAVFDFGVNAGPSRSVKTLQRVIGVSDDGSVGPITLAALGAVPPRQVVDSFTEARLEFYQSLKTFDTFGRGWTRRTQEVASDARSMMA